MPPILSSFLTMSRLLAAATFFGACIITGLFTTSFFRVLPSIGMVGLLAVAGLCYCNFRRSYQQGNGLAYAGFVAVYVLHLFSGLLTGPANWNEYVQDIVLQLPFLVLPLAFWLLPPLPARHLRWLWLWLIGVTVAASLLSTGNYLLHMEQINESYLHSKVMPTEPGYIRFSLLITLAIAAGIVLLLHQSIGAGLKPWLLAALLWLALYQHMLAVRSGLLTFYILGGLALLWLVFRKRQYAKALQLAAALLALPLVSYVAFPTFRNKLTNTQEDVVRIEHTASANTYSLVGRVYSYKAALFIIKEHPLFGVGKANMQDKMAEYYQQEFPTIHPRSYLLPHNQYLYSTVAFGIVGALIFILGFYYAGVATWQGGAPLLLIQYVIVTLSFLVEYTLETQVGIAFSLFFLLLALEGSKPPTQNEMEWRPA